MGHREIWLKVLFKEGRRIFCWRMLFIIEIEVLVDFLLHSPLPSGKKSKSPPSHWLQIVWITSYELPHLVGILISKKPTSWLVWTMTTTHTDLLKGSGFGRWLLYLKSNAFYGNVSIKAYQLEKSLLLEASTSPFVVRFATPQWNQSCTCLEIILRFELSGIPSLLPSTLIYFME